MNSTLTPALTLNECYLGKNASALTGINRQGETRCDENVQLLDVSNLGIWSDAATSSGTGIKLYRTQKFMRRFCAPASFNEGSRYFYQKVMQNSGASDKMDEYFSDLRNTWGIILISFAFAFLLALFYLFILRWCTGFFVWLSILFFLGVVMALAVLCHVKSKRIDDDQSTSNGNTTNKTTSSKLYWTAVVLYIVFALTLCAICYFFKTIELCIAVLKSAAIFVRTHFSVAFVPMIFSVLLFGYLMFGFFVLLYLWSIGDVTKRDGLPLGQVNWDTNIRKVIWFHLYSMILICALFLYYGQFIIVGAASIWYFNNGVEGEKVYPAPVRTATWWGVRYHFGSIVFAAFLLSIIWTIKLILMYIKYQAEKINKQGPQSKVITMLLCILMCFVSCFERFIKFISKTGLIMVAITGHNFCVSCKDGINLLLRHPLKFGLVGVLGEIFVFLGKIFIATFTTFLGYLVVTNNSIYVEKLYSPLIPCIFFFIIGLVVGSIFMAVYGLAADAIMCSFLVDKDLVEKQRKPISRAPEPLKVFFEENKTDSGKSDDDDKKK